MVACPTGRALCMNQHAKQLVPLLAQTRIFVKKPLAVSQAAPLNQIQTAAESGTLLVVKRATAFTTLTLRLRTEKQQKILKSSVGKWK